MRGCVGSWVASSVRPLGSTLQSSTVWAPGLRRSSTKFLWRSFYPEVDSMGAMKTIMEGFLDDYNMSDLLYHRQRVLNAKISPLQVHQLSGFQERVRCFDTGRLLCLSQRPLRPEMVQTHFKVYLISSVCAPENVLQTKRERKRVAKKVFVQISSMSVSEFLVPSCSRAGSAQFCYHVLWIHQSHPCPLWKVVFGSKPEWKCSCLPLKAGVEQRRQIHQNHFIFQKICGQVDFVRVLLAYHRLWLAVARPDLSAGQMVWAGNTCAIHNWDAFCAGICRSLCGHRLDVWNDSVQSWPQGGLGWWIAFFPWSNEPRNLGASKSCVRLKRMLRSVRPRLRPDKWGSSWLWRGFPATIHTVLYKVSN